MGPILNKTDMSCDSVFCYCDIGGGEVVTVISGGIVRNVSHSGQKSSRVLKNLLHALSTSLLVC